MRSRFHPLRIVLLTAAVPLLFGSSAQAAPPWTRISPAEGSATQAVAAGRAGEVHLAIASALFDSFDRGDNWILADFPDLFVDVEAFAVSPSDRSVVYAGTINAQVLRTTDGGVNWTVGGLPSGSPATGVTTLAVDPSSASTVYAGRNKVVGNCLFTRCFADLFRSDDEGETWTSITATIPGGFPSDYYAVAVDPTARATLYAVTDVAFPPRHLYRSSDRGSTWEDRGPLPTDLDVVLLVDSRLPSTVYAASPTGLYRSHDGGTSWTSSRLGTTPVRSLALDPRHPGTLYAGGPFGVFRSIDGFDTWTSLNAGLADLDVSAIALDAGPPAVLYAGTSSSAYRRDPDEVPACQADSRMLCLNESRFLARVSFQTEDISSDGVTVSLTPDAGGFWFFTPNNIELVVKVVDGRALNGRFWVFGAGLTNVEYDLTITDTTTGAVWLRHNSGGEIASFSDTAAFP